MRLFLALELSAEVRREMAARTASLREARPELAWISEAKLHLTIRFFGEVDAARAEMIAAALPAVASQHRPLTLRMSGVGAFPAFRRARVLWCGVESDPRLELLHHDAELAAARLGFEVEARPFRPHITLARVSRPMPEDHARALRRMARSVNLALEQDVGEVVLLESTLAPQGARYRRVAAASLGGG